MTSHHRKQRERSPGRKEHPFPAGDLSLIFLQKVKHFPSLIRISGERAYSRSKGCDPMSPTLSRQEAERLVNTYSDLILRLSYTYSPQNPRPRPFSSSLRPSGSAPRTTG